MTQKRSRLDNNACAVRRGRYRLLGMALVYCGLKAQRRPAMASCLEGRLWLRVVGVWGTLPVALAVTSATGMVAYRRERGLTLGETAG